MVVVVNPPALLKVTIKEITQLSEPQKLASEDQDVFVLEGGGQTKF